MCFFGHRDVYENIDFELELKIEKLIIQENVTIFWVGGCGAFDEKAANALRKLKEKYSSLSLILINAYVPQLHSYGYLPFDGFDYPPEVESAPKDLQLLEETNIWLKIVISLYLIFATTMEALMTPLKSLKKD